MISFGGQEKLTDYTRMASEMTETGESLEHVDSLIEELNTFHSLCQVLVLVFGWVGFLVKKLSTVIFFADWNRQKRRTDATRWSDTRQSAICRCRWNRSEISRITSGEPIAGRKIAQTYQCSEESQNVSNSYEKSKEHIIRKVEVSCRRLKNELFQANKWCSQGIEVLGSQNIEKYSMFPEKAEQVLLELEQFVASADAFNVSGADDLYVLLEDGVSNESKALVTQVCGHSRIFFNI